MRLKELNIVSYGKISDKKIKLKDKFNIIYGPNESGKSTIRSFVFNLLYGGTVPGSTRAIYSKEYERYLPWSNPRYEGGMTIEYKGETYYFYRNFLKSMESFSIHNLETGREAKELFCVDTSRKVEVIGEEFFSIKESTLRDLFVITEDFILDDNLPYDLKDRIINHYSTNSETISLDDIFKNIRDCTDSSDSKKEIRNLKQSIKAIDERLSMQESISQYDSLLREVEILDSDIKNIESSLKRLKDKFQNRLYLEKASKNDDEKRLENVIRLEEKIKNVEKDLINIKKGPLPKGMVFLLLSFIIGFIGLILKNKAIIGFGLSVLLGFFYSVYKRSLVESKRKELKNFYNQLDLLKKDIINRDFGDATNSNIRESYEDLEIKRMEISEKKLKRERLLERLRLLDKERELNYSLKDRRNNYNEKLEDLIYKKKMGELSISILKDISQKSFQNASSLLIEDGSEFIKKITKGKYSKLYVGDNGEINLFDESIKQIVSVDGLSQGTIGQVYLAYRLGLIVNSGIDFPIFIDDGFALYDDERQNNSLNLLNEISREYQVIFFTNRRETLENLKFKEDINIINLWESR